jgi:hypothetical protein
MNASIPTHRFYRKRPTPWPVRIFLVVAIAFGIWVDVSTADLGTTDSGTDDHIAANPTQTPLLGLHDEHSTIANIVRSLAARH